VTGKTVDFKGSIESVGRQQNDYIFLTIVENPLKVVFVVLKNSKNVALDNHVVNNIFNWYGYNWKDFSIFKKHQLAEFLYLCYGFIYILIFLYSLCVVSVLYEEREWALIGMIGYFFVFWIIPGLIIGTGGSRLRIDYEIFFLILIIGYNSKQVKCGI